MLTDLGLALATWYTCRLHTSSFGALGFSLLGVPVVGLGGCSAAGHGSWSVRQRVGKGLTRALRGGEIQVLDMVGLEMEIQDRASATAVSNGKRTRIR